MRNNSRQPKNMNSRLPRILTNHVGYETHGPKHAVVQGRAEDAVGAYRLRNLKTDTLVHAGKPEKVGRVKRWHGWYFWTLDCDEVTKPGTYQIECAINHKLVTSFPFVIQEDILERRTLSDIIYYFKGQRCSGQLDAADHHVPFDGLDRPPIDAHGGWYDATGDYGKHLSHLSYATYFNPQQLCLVVWSLLKAHGALKARENPNFAEYQRRLLDEALFGADYLVRVHPSGGSFYRTVQAPGPEKRPEDRCIQPEMRGFYVTDEMTQDAYRDVSETGNAQRSVYQVGYRAGGGVAIAALALASTHDVAGAFNSATYLQAAEDAHAYLERNNHRLLNDGKENILDDYCALLAAVALYQATEKPVYRTAADVRAQNLLERLTATGYWRADGGDRPFFHPADAGLPVVSLLEYLRIAPEHKPEILAAVHTALNYELTLTGEVANPFGYSRQRVQTRDGEQYTTFFFPHDAETAPWWQGENARLASVAAAARRALPYFEDDPAFQTRLRRYARNQLNWILGLNPFDVCMLDGTGRNNPEYRFFESYAYANAPGGICNGVTADPLDPQDVAFYESYTLDGQDYNWRWTEQWLPHAAWYLLATIAPR